MLDVCMQQGVVGFVCNTDAVLDECSTHSQISQVRQQFSTHAAKAKYYNGRSIKGISTKEMIDARYYWEVGKASRLGAAGNRAAAPFQRCAIRKKLTTAVALAMETRALGTLGLDLLGRSV